MVDVASLLINPGLGPGYDSSSAMVNDEEQGVEVEEEEEEDIEKNEDDPFWK